MRIRSGATLAILFLAASSARAQDDALKKFLNARCVECHGAEIQKRNLRLDTLPRDVTSADSFSTSVKVFDKIESGELPPHKSERPPKHGQHLAFDQGKNYPLPNLFVSMLQRLGVETDRFATSTGTMRGLETA